MIAAYLIVVSLVYGLLWFFDPRAADALVGAVVFLLLVPAVLLERQWWKGRGRA